MTKPKATAKRQPLAAGEHPEPTSPAEQVDEQPEPDATPHRIEKVDLPDSGGWARFRDPERITEAGRRMFKLAVAKGKMGDPAGIIESDDMAIAMFVSDWSLTMDDNSPRPIPQADPAGLQTLMPADYDALLNAALLMLPLVFGTDFEVTMDQNSPFGASKGSAGS